MAKGSDGSRWELLEPFVFLIFGIWVVGGDLVVWVFGV
jgi:hypothetical protein